MYRDEYVLKAFRETVNAFYSFSVKTNPISNYNYLITSMCMCVCVWHADPRDMQRIDAARVLERHSLKASYSIYIAVGGKCE